MYVCMYVCMYACILLSAYCEVLNGALHHEVPLATGVTEICIPNIDAFRCLDFTGTHVTPTVSQKNYNAEHIIERLWTFS